jgi:AcrR family transcriptional regulator
VFTQEFNRLREMVEADQEEPVAKLLLLLTGKFASVMKWMTRLMPIAFEFYALAGRDKEVRQFLQDYFQAYRSELACLIQRGVERGEFHAVDAQATAITLAALYEGLALLYFVDAQAFQWAEQAEAAVQLLLAGLQQ